MEGEIMNTLKSSWLIPMAVILLGHFLIDFYVSVLPPLMPALVDKLGLTMTMSGLVFSFMSITSAWTQPLFGLTGNLSSKPWVLPFSLFWLALFMGLAGVAPSFLLLIIFVSLAGIGSAAYHPIGSVAMYAVSGPYKGIATSLYITVGTVGVTVAPLVVPSVLKHWGPKGAFYLAIPGIVISLFLFNYFNKVNVGEPLKTKEITNCPPLGKRGVWLVKLVLSSGTKLMAIQCFAVFLPIYYVLQGRDEAYGSYLLSIYLLFQVIGGIIGGVSSDHIGKKPTLVLSGILGLVFYGGFFYFSGFLSVASLMLGALFLKAGFPVSIVMGQDLLPERATFITGIMMGFTFGIGGFGGILTGALSDALGGNLHSALMASLVLIAISIVTAVLLPDSRIMDKSRRLLRIEI
jgi:FSR family fosmidomycin resistance protein-like MFS transporter